jgi:hypothetical protein
MYIYLYIHNPRFLCYSICVTEKKNTTFEGIAFEIQCGKIINVMRTSDPSVNNKGPSVLNHGAEHGISNKANTWTR